MINWCEGVPRLGGVYKEFLRRGEMQAIINALVNESERLDMSLPENGIAYNTADAVHRELSKSLMRIAQELQNGK